MFRHHKRDIGKTCSEKHIVNLRDVLPFYIVLAGDFYGVCSESFLRVHTIAHFLHKCGQVRFDGFIFDLDAVEIADLDGAAVLYRGNMND
jgi:hypothetical protein